MNKRVNLIDSFAHILYIKLGYSYSDWWLPALTPSQLENTYPRLMDPFDLGIRFGLQGIFQKQIA